MPDKTTPVNDERKEQPDSIIEKQTDIREILIRARKLKIPVHLNYESRAFTGSIIKISHTSIYFFSEQSLAFLYTENTNIKIEFSITIKEFEYIIPTSIISMTGKSIQCILPKKILVYKVRSSERINATKSIFVKFSIISEASNEEKEKAAVKERSNRSPMIRAAYAELLKPEVNMNSIFTLIQKELLKHASKLLITMKKKDMHYDLAYRLVDTHKKPLYIVDTKDVFAYIHTIEDNIGISFLPYYENLKKAGWNSTQILGDISKIQEKDLSDNARSYIIMPIIVFNSVVGFVKIFHKEPFIYNKENIAQFKEYISLLTEAVVKNYLFNLDSNQDFTMRAVDISETGILFTAQDPNLIKYLQQDQKLKISLKFDAETVIHINGIIRRLKTVKEGKSVAIEFTSINARAKQTIQEYIKSSGNNHPLSSFKL